MTSDRSRQDRVRIEVTLPIVLVNELRVYSRGWQIPLSSTVEVACIGFLKDRTGRADQSPLQLRLKPRSGPLTKIERALSAAAVMARRARGGRRL